VVEALRRMNRYGLLGQYIPAFGRIIGQMQHDLFHVYTVDEHILNVLGNLQRFSEKISSMNFHYAANYSSLLMTRICFIWQPYFTILQKVVVATTPSWEWLMLSVSASSMASPKKTVS